MSAITLQPRIYTVSELNREAALALGEHFLMVWVEGEISNLSAPSSGHLYFSLKDAGAQVRCALFKNQQRGLRCKPANGMQVIVRAEVSLYEPRGDYQLIIERLEAAGDGALRRAFEALRWKLSAEGLFDPSRKKPLPSLPRAIGIVTSPTGAALRDILSVLRRRFPAIPVIVYPASVQGANAKLEVAAAIDTANRRADCEVLIVARGGGSLEDLQAFNEEIVARAIAASSIPVISGIGHETDVTIADFAADLRAATPTAAAEHATPDRQQWLNGFVQSEKRLEQLLQRKLTGAHQRLAWLDKRLKQQHPGQKLRRNAQRLDELALRLTQGMQRKQQQHLHQLAAANAKLWRFNPAARIRSQQQRQQYLVQRLQLAMQNKLEQNRLKLANTRQTLHAVSPLATLNRGYALVTEAESGSLVRSARQLAVGDRIRIRVADGQFVSEIVDR
ncbi:MULTISPECIES: exodeoxyribonuclease VII large subunit [Methylomicrobium]|uniref:Exodeoxyribonuclease 7 large subunit n=1 Tax=Methylomicrobium album BG8 TaxID=686340 RepID=H8GLG9_METAL|nr:MULTISPECIES: exodeoxyribonuclease VII large subunit [Methylomicrobium]EIC29334.1 exodeoxyribonuclease VII, large subunit [Methylomicrobium album BG8]